MEERYFLPIERYRRKKWRNLTLALQHKLALQGQADQKYYDSADLKVLLKVGDKTIYRMRKAGHIPSVKIGKKYFYPKNFFNNCFQEQDEVEEG